MTARAWLALAALVVVLGHLAAGWLVVLVAAEVIVFALACVTLGWVLATGPVPRAAAGKAGSG